MHTFVFFLFWGNNILPEYLITRLKIILLKKTKQNKTKKILADRQANFHKNIVWRNHGNRHWVEGIGVLLLGPVHWSCVPIHHLSPLLKQTGLLASQSYPTMTNKSECIRWVYIFVWLQKWMLVQAQDLLKPGVTICSCVHLGEKNAYLLVAVNIACKHHALEMHIPFSAKYNFKWT